MKCTKICLFICLLVILTALFFVFKTEPYFPLWAKYAPYNKAVKVLDTNSSLGRYSEFTKDLTLKDMALIHGHLCDGLVIAYIELKAALELLFPDGVADRTDLRVITKNSPCWVDASAFMTGARINFGTLSIDPDLKNSIIIQKISTGETYRVSLKEGIFPKELLELETKIKNDYKKGIKTTDEDIKSLENQANAFSKKLLNTDPEELLDIKKLENYEYKQNIQTGLRTDVINKSYYNCGLNRS